MSMMNSIGLMIAFAWPASVEMRFEPQGDSTALRHFEEREQRSCVSDRIPYRFRIDVHLL
jgi:hypothetical protein